MMIQLHMGLSIQNGGTHDATRQIRAHHARSAPSTMALSLALSALPHLFADEPGIRVKGLLQEPRVRCRTARE